MENFRDIASCFSMPERRCKCAIYRSRPHGAWLLENTEAREGWARRGEVSGNTLRRRPRARYEGIREYLEPIPLALLAASPEAS